MTEDWHEDPPEGTPTPAREFASVTEFVRGFLAPTYRRDLGDTRTWCAQWDRHPEAVSRLTGLWLAYEDLRSDATGLSTWWLSHCDPTMRVLLDADHGPFAWCTRGHSDQLTPLPVDTGA